MGCLPTKRRDAVNKEYSDPVCETTKRPEISKPAIEASKFEAECLDEHNRLRARHGCPPLQLDRNMCRYADDWARTLAQRSEIQHRPNNKYGENLYWASGSEVSGKDCVQSWYNEIKDYRFGNGGFSMKTGHFTQVVWKSSSKLGIAIQKRGPSTWVVANYDPPGNYSGQYRENVPPPRG
ncbi:unnamed protein product [Hermetia illucens]|uniref:SCP domain-containing protein n=1 Tax=Hermetia illucens TaxID=343691 RepID=A0A7R8UBT4_HERIL|nr:unnamed protein product [Hermetia illucens]